MVFSLFYRKKWKSRDKMGRLITGWFSIRDSWTKNHRDSLIRWVNADRQTDYWLVQYQRLVDQKPQRHIDLVSTGRQTDWLPAGSVSETDGPETTETHWSSEYRQTDRQTDYWLVQYQRLMDQKLQRHIDQVSTGRQTDWLLASSVSESPGLETTETYWSGENRQTDRLTDKQTNGAETTLIDQVSTDIQTETHGPETAETHWSGKYRQTDRQTDWLITGWFSIRDSWTRNHSDSLIRWVQTDRQTDYWLVQYQRLMDQKPQRLIDQVSTGRQRDWLLAGSVSGTHGPETTTTHWSGEYRQTDCWLVQYQRLLDQKPQWLIDQVSTDRQTDWLLAGSVSETHGPETTETHWSGEYRQTDRLITGWFSIRDSWTKTIETLWSGWVTFPW